MARKNARAERTMTRRQTGWVPPVPIEDIVVPKGKCFYQARRGKLVFTKDEAATALKQAQHSRKRSGSAYAEKRVYACPEGGCGGYHLTSATTYQQRSAS
jgi:hypothetical protein